MSRDIKIKNHSPPLNTAIICGGGGLIGSHLSEYFCEHFDLVFSLDLKFKSSSASYETIICDLTQQEEVNSAFKYIFSESPFELVTLINAQAIADPDSGPLEKLSLDQWNRYLSANLTSYFLCSKAFLLYKKEFSKGRIINISSTRHLMAESNTEAYSATKGGIVGFTQALAISLSDDGILANSVSPGWIGSPDKDYRETDHKQHPAGRVGLPQDISEMCLFLATQQSGFITGQDFVVDGGMTKKMIYQ